MKETISVIIPVYNVKKYLPEALESALKQDYQKLQVILIDDGSTDGSAEICDEYARIDNRIIVIHQKNGGAASAKNTGLRVATGEFLAFLDSDDYLETGAYTFMVEQLRKYQADMVQCCFQNVFRDKIETQVGFSKIEEYTCVSYLELFTKDWTCGLLWDKLYRRKLFEDVFFEEGHKIDDEFFTYRGVMNATKVVRVPKVIYNYRKRLSGVMLSKDFQEKIVLDKLEYLSIRRKIVTEKFPELKDVFDEHYLNMLLIVSKDSSASAEGMRKIKQLLKEYNSEARKISVNFGLKRRLIRLKYKSVEKLLKEKNVSEGRTDISSYYD